MDYVAGTVESMAWSLTVVIPLRNFFAGLISHTILVLVAQPGDIRRGRAVEDAAKS